MNFAYFFETCSQLCGSKYHDLSLRDNHKNNISEEMIEGTVSYALREEIHSGRTFLKSTNRD